jgi:Cu/Ag efflux protein CusF
MTISTLRPASFGLGLLVLAACASTTPALSGAASPAGIDLGPSSRVVSTVAATDAASVARQAPSRNGVQLAHGGHTDAHATGVVNSVDTAGRRLNITHDPIPAIGWPSMTMDFPVAPSVNLGAVKSGARVDFTIEKGKNGMYEIQSVAPAGNAR